MPIRSPTAKRVAPRALRNHMTDDLVAWHGAGPMGREVTFGEVEVGAAHAARRHSDQNFARPRQPGQAVRRIEDGAVSIGPGCSTHHASTAPIIAPARRCSHDDAGRDVGGCRCL